MAQKAWLACSLVHVPNAKRFHVQVKIGRPVAVSCWHSNVNLTSGSISQTQFCTCTGLDGDTACLLTDFPWTSLAHHSHVLSTSFMIWKLYMRLVNQAYSTLKQWMK